MPRIERPDMQAYGVPTELEGTLPWVWAETRLVAARNYWLTTVDPQSRPHSMPVWGVWLTSPDRFWMGCDPSALKARNLAANPAVVVAPGDTIEVVSVEGTAAPRPPTQVVAQAFGDKYEPDPVKRAEMVGFFMESSMYEITPIKAFGMIETPEDFGPAATRWVW